MTNEEWHVVLAKQSSPHQQILQLLRAGHSHAEVAEQLSLTTKTVQRLVRKLKRRHEL